MGKPPKPKTKKSNPPAPITADNKKYISVLILLIAYFKNYKKIDRNEIKPSVPVRKNTSVKQVCI